MSDPLTLCYVADAASIHVQRWLSFFVGRGHRVYCLTDKPGDIEGVHMIALPTRETLLEQGRKVKKGTVITARAEVIQEHLERIQPDILHAHFLYYRGWAAALARFHPFAITLFGSDVYLPKAYSGHRPWLLYLQRQFLNWFTLMQADLVTGVSAALCRIARRRTLNTIPVELLPIGTDSSVFHKNIDTSAVAALREQLQIPEGSLVVLSPRQITPLYNIDTIIESIPKVLERAPNTVFILKDAFCNTPDRKAYVASLKSRVDSLGIAQAVRWMDEVPYESLPVFYTLADAVVSVPSTDGMPVTLFEAMACGTPVIVGDLPSYDEVIIHDETGLRVSLKNTDALASAICNLIQNPKRSLRLTQAADAVLQRYGIFEDQLLAMERHYYRLRDSSIPGKQPLLKALALWGLQKLIRWY